MLEDTFIFSSQWPLSAGKLSCTLSRKNWYSLGHTLHQLKHGLVDGKELNFTFIWKNAFFQASQSFRCSLPNLRWTCTVLCWAGGPHRCYQVSVHYSMSKLTTSAGDEIIISPTENPVTKTEIKTIEQWQVRKCRCNMYARLIDNNAQVNSLKKITKI